MAAPRILHLHSGFAPGGKELRSVQLINAFGPGVHHAIVSGDPDAMGAAQKISRSISVEYPRDFPSLRGTPLPGRLSGLARAMQGYDLVLTYNWGAMDAVLAHTMFSQAFALPPLIHHEDGFNEDEHDKPKLTRNWYRRIALGKASALVVPSEKLEGIALVEWAQPIGRVKRIANGIDTLAFAKSPRADGLRGIIKRKDEKWVGTLAGLRAVKNLPRLVRAAAQLPENWHLVIFGEGPDRSRILAEAERLEIQHRVHLPGHTADPAKTVGLFDIFALSSDSEQFPISVVEAMAAGVPVAATDVGDVADMVADENRDFIVAKSGVDTLGEALSRLAADQQLRSAIGASNRRKARSHFDEKKMIDSYRRLYSSAMKDKSLP